MTGRTRRHAGRLRVAAGLAALMLAGSGSGAAGTFGRFDPSPGPPRGAATTQRLRAEIVVPAVRERDAVPHRWSVPDRWAAIGPRDPARDWPFRADPHRWPRLFANTTECTLSFDPIRRRLRWR